MVAVFHRGNLPAFCTVGPKGKGTLALRKPQDSAWSWADGS